MNPQFVASEVVTATKMNQLPKGVLGVAQATANQTGISTITDLTSLTVTVNLVAGRRIRVSGQAVVSGTTAGDVIIGTFRESSTELGRWAQFTPHAANINLQQHGAVILTPGAGSHTYKLSLQRASGTGTCGIAAGATLPAFILVEDLGSST